MAFKQLEIDVIEVNRMLATLIKRLRADSRQLNADS